MQCASVKNAAFRGVLRQASRRQSRLARVCAHMAASFWWVGQLESVADHAQRALTIATDMGDRSLETLARARLGDGDPGDSSAGVGKPAPKSVDTSLAGFAGSVDTRLAGFGGRRRRGSRIAMRAARR
jgi:hypothetical protein